MFMLAMILGMGGIALSRTRSSLMKEILMLEADENCSKKIYGYADPANEAVDPSLIRSDRTRFPIELEEAGPFGVSRNIHQDAAYIFPTFGRFPGLYNI